MHHLTFDFPHPCLESTPYCITLSSSLSASFFALPLSFLISLHNYLTHLIRYAQITYVLPKILQLPPHTDDFDNHNDNDNNRDHAGNAQFESVYFGKAELCDELDHSSASATAQCQLTYPDAHLQDQFIITSLPQASTSPSSAAAAATGSDGHSASTHATLPCAEGSVTGTGAAAPIATPISCPNDDAYFLQYLGNKFGKYSASTKSTVQFHINRILYKADMGCYDHVDASKLSDTDL